MCFFVVVASGVAGVDGVHEGEVVFDVEGGTGAEEGF
jgi:hypothetical protein